MKVCHDIETKRWCNEGLSFRSRWNPTAHSSTFASHCPAIIMALKTGKTIVVDEIDNGLHPMLVKHLVGIFNSRESNPNGAQLIFNTHDIDLLDLDFLRRDQIYFCGKELIAQVYLIFIHFLIFSPWEVRKSSKGDTWLAVMARFHNIGGVEW